MKFKTLILHSLKKVDFFGVPIRFTLNNKTLQKSYCGGLLSLLLFSILIAILHQNIFSLINREQVTTFSEETNYQDPPPINLESFRLNLAMSYSDKRMNDGTYFKVEVFQAFSTFSKENNQINRQKILIPLEKCTTENFLSNDMQNAFLSLSDSVSIKSFICPKKNTIFYMKGSVVNPDFTYIQIKVSACMNSSSTTCVPQENIDRIFSENANRIYLDFYVTTNIINPKNFDHPVSSYFDDKIYIMLDRKNYKEKNFYLTKNIIMTDKNFLHSNFKEEFSTYTYDNLFDENSVKLDVISNTTVYAGVYFRAHSIVKTHYRSSVKVGTCASYIGGIWSIMYFFFAFVGEKFNNQKTRIKLANALYEFRGETERKKLIFPEKTLKNGISQCKTQSLKRTVEEKLRILVNKIKEWKLPYDETFFWRKYFSKNKENIHIIQKLREKAKKTIHKDLDVVHLLKKVKSSDRLRNLILNKDQNFVFEFFHKTEVNYNNDSHLQSKSSRLYDSTIFRKPELKRNDLKEEKILDLLRLHKSYENLREEMDNSKLNLKIISNY